MHDRVLAAAPLQVRLTRHARRAVPWLVPCDMTDFVEHYEESCCDTALCCLLALVKEPSACSVLREEILRYEANCYTAQDLERALMKMLTAVDQAAN